MPFSRSAAPGISLIPSFAPLLWRVFFAGLGDPAMYGFFVDLTLFAAGVYGLVMLGACWRKNGRVA